MFKTTNKCNVQCLRYYRSYYAAITQNFKMVNPFDNLFLRIGVFKFLCTNCPSKVQMTLIGDPNFGSRKYLIFFSGMHMT